MARKAIILVGRARKAVAGIPSRKSEYTIQDEEHDDDDEDEDHYIMMILRMEKKRMFD